MAIGVSNKGETAMNTHNTNNNNDNNMHSKDTVYIYICIRLYTVQFCDQHKISMAILKYITHGN